MCSQGITASWLDGPRSSIGASAAAVVGGAVAKCVTGTLGDGRDVAVRMDLLAWDAVRQGRRPAPSETCVGVLITRRSQVQILPPLPTSQQVRGPFPVGEGLLLWPCVTKCVVRIVRESPGSRGPAGRTVTIEHDCDVDGGDRWVGFADDRRRSGTGYRSPSVVASGASIVHPRRRLQDHVAIVTFNATLAG